MKTIIILIFALLFFSACTETTTTTTKTETSNYIGYFVDSHVNGVEYTCGDISGITGDQKDQYGNTLDGSFQFKEDCSVEFSLGKIFIGSYYGAEIIKNKNINKTDEYFLFPTNLAGQAVTDTNHPKVINILRFLQSLDDNSSNDTIDITSTVRNNLNKSDVLSLNLTNTSTTEEDLNTTVIKGDATKELITTTKAIAHFEEIVRKELDETIDTVPPAQPYLTEVIHAINSQNSLYKDVEVNGEVDAKIFLAFNSDGDISNVNFYDTNKSIQADGKQILRLDFDNDEITNFHYYFMLQDNKEQNSTIYHLEVHKDLIPPKVKTNNINIPAYEEKSFVKNINAIDESGYITYQLVKSSEDPTSKDWDSFKIDSDGNVTFCLKPNDDNNTDDAICLEPNYDDNINASYVVVARAIDEAGNMTDVTLTIYLKNILDNPPVLTKQQGDIYKTSVIEMDYNIGQYNIGKCNNTQFCYDLNTTLNPNFIDAPDNFDPNLEPNPKYFNIESCKTTLDDRNCSGLFHLNRDTGLLIITDDTNTTFDYEEYFRASKEAYIDINFSVENENNVTGINKTFQVLRIDINNTIDTPPVLKIPPLKTIKENSSIGTTIIPIDHNLTDPNLSDRDLTMTFHISGGNEAGKFDINETTGVVTTKASFLDDFNESKQTNEYNLSIIATNVWFNNTEHNSSIVTLIINVTNVVDIPPSIRIISSESNITERTAAGTIIASLETNSTTFDQNETTLFKFVSITKNGGAPDMYPFTDTHPFTIDDQNGTVTTTSALETEYVENANQDNTLYSITIEALNKHWDDTVHKSNPVSFDINITNVIDIKPSLGPVPTIEPLDENASVGSFIMSIESNGSTYDENNITSYEIISGNGNDFFDINASDENNITIYLKNLLNGGAHEGWEDTKTHTLEYVAKNTWYDGSVNQSDPRSVTINIANIIEKKPSIYVPARIDIHENVDDGYIMAYLETNSTKTDEQNISNITLVNDYNDFRIRVNENNSSVWELIVRDDVITNIDENTIDYEDNRKSYTLELNVTNELEDNNINKYNLYTMDINITDDIDSDIPLLVLLVDFQDVNFSTGLTDIDNSINIALTNYLQRISKNKFKFKKANETYGNDDVATGIHNDGIVRVSLPLDHPQDNLGLLHSRAKSAIKAADTFVNFAAFDTQDTDGNTSIQDKNVSKEELQILILMAEDENLSLNPAYEGSNSFDSNLTLDGVNIAYTTADGNYVALGELDQNSTIQVGIIAKLLSEKLFGFDNKNTYDYGFLDLMGEGYKGADANETIGTRPIHPSIHNKMKQGWDNPILLRKGLNNLKLYNTHLDVFNTYRINTNDENLYYLIENRNYTKNGEDVDTTNYDNGFYSLIENFNGGLIIWKVDKINSPYLEPISDGNSDFFKPSDNPISFSVPSVFEIQNDATIEQDDIPNGTKTFEVTIEVK
jgi:hypothetical protein